MADRKRGLPSVWVTHISGLLAGDDTCEWAAWFKSRNWYKKLKDDTFDAVRWNTEHTELVRRTAAVYREAGYTVTLEDENKFKVQGQTAEIAGKPDIIASNDTEIVIVDCKSGKLRNAHWWQVAIYLRFGKNIVGEEALLGRTLRGEAVYTEESQQPATKISLDDLEQMKAKERINQQLQNIGLSFPPATTPSERECGFCDIPPEECKDRMASSVRVTQTTDF